MDKAAFNEALRNRTKQFALRIIKLFQTLPKSGESQIIGKQLVKSGTSVAANYRAACRARSKAEFISKINIVIEEADESGFWMELLIESKIVQEKKLIPLLKETIELLSIFSSARKTSIKKKVNP
jgi:four helix bundle protein